VSSSKKRIAPKRLRFGLVMALFAIVMTVVLVIFRTGLEEADALAAPGTATPRPHGSALAPPSTAAASAHASGASAATPAPAPAPAPSATPPANDGDAGAPEAVDLAIAPDGGVPFHPTATAYRSPFAQPGTPETSRAKVAMLLNSVDDYSVVTGSFTADFFLSFTSQVPMPQLSLSFANGKVESKEVLADRPTFKLYRLTGVFKSPPNLRKYPFDSQELQIIVEDNVHGIDRVRMSVDKERTKVARSFRAVGWQVAYIEARALSQSYPDRFEGDDLYYSRYVFSLGLDRFATSAAFKVFVPAFVIVLIALLGMWVPAEEMEVRSNAGAPMLAAAVLFHFSLMQELPATSYLTRADKLMLGVYISLALGMLSTWWMFIVHEENIPKVFRTARVLVPVLTVLVMAAATFA